MKTLACFLWLAAAAAAQDRYPVDWQKLEPEILDRFTALLKIDTSNPPGNETKAADAIKAVLEHEGIPVKMFALDPARARTWQTPMRLNATTRAYFERLAAISPPADAARYRGILDPAHAAEIDRYFRQHDPGHYSILRTSVVPTILKAGFRNNVIPSEAEANLDVRALPDEEGPLGGAHSDDEHISVRSLMTMIEYLWNTVLEVAAN